MKKRILSYRKRIDELLEKNQDGIDWEDVLEEHLAQIGFFQHERVVHLFVTIAFALITIISALFTLNSCDFGMILLTLLFLALLIPYIMHYYLLENEVQKMYEQYDRILEKIRNKCK